MMQEQKAAGKGAYPVSPRIEAKALLASGFSLLWVGLRQITTALWVLLVGVWPGRDRSSVGPR